MIHVSFIAHNVTKHSLIPFPNTGNLLCHLKRFPAMIAALAASLGPWGTISHVPNPLAACCSRARFPMDTSDNYTVTGDCAW